MNSEVNKKEVPTLYGTIEAVPQVDKTLTMSGRAADAKVVGDIIRGEQRAVNFSYDNNGNGLNATTIQGAIDELMTIKAPSGYVEGVFEASTQTEFNAKIAELESNMDVKTIKRYAITKGNWENTFPSADYFVEIRKAWHGYSSVTATAVCEGNIITLHRALNNNIWGEWEWENPLTTRDVEYRTTEKFNGLPVYTKHISYIPSTDVGNESGFHGFAIEFSTPNFRQLVRYGGTMAVENGSVLPSFDTSEGFIGLNFMNSGGIAVAMKKKVIKANTALDIQVWYTKW